LPGAMIMMRSGTTPTLIYASGCRTDRCSITKNSALSFG
jgi:hypothetical protein